MTTIDLDALGLPRLYSPGEAAEILRGLGLSEMTECALRTRAYRRQVPFHLNGRRIRFTIADLREIVEGQAQRPAPSAEVSAPRARARASRSSQRMRTSVTEAWRARPAAITPAIGEAR